MIIKTTKFNVSVICQQTDLGLYITDSDFYSRVTATANSQQKKNSSDHSALLRKKTVYAILGQTHVFTVS